MRLSVVAGNLAVEGGRRHPLLGQASAFDGGAAENAEARIKLPVLGAFQGSEAFLHVQFESAGKTAWCEAGHVVGWEQLPVSMPKKVARRVAADQAPAVQIEVEERDGLCTVSNGNVALAVSIGRGRIEHLRWKREEFLVSGPELQIWRGPTDNDGIKGRDDHYSNLGRWRRLGLDKAEIVTLPAKMERNRDGTVSFALEHMARCGSSERAVTLRHLYTFAPSGQIRVQNVFTVGAPLADLPRLGVVLRLSPGFEKLSWFGPGPQETYADRKRSAIVDLHESTVAEQYVPYIMPQEHGNHCDVRWVGLANDRGAQFVVRAAGPLNFSASHFTAHDLYRASHTYDLKPRPETILNLDLAQRGLGTASCGPDVLPPYKIAAGTHRWSYLLELSGTE